MRPACRLLPVLFALACAAPASADWLITTAGEPIETRGVWEVKGRLVVFRGADGELASLRASDVDLEASRWATEEAARKTAEPAPAAESPEGGVAEERRPIIAHITDDDVGHVDGTDVAAAPQLVMYSTSRCSVCKTAKRFLEERNIAFIERDIETSEVYREEYEARGGGGVPLIDVDGTVLLGFQPARLSGLLRLEP